MPQNGIPYIRLFLGFLGIAIMIGATAFVGADLFEQRPFGADPAAHVAVLLLGLGVLGFVFYKIISRLGRI